MEALHSIAVADNKVQSKSQYKSMSNKEFDDVFNYTYLILYKRLYSIDCDEYDIQNIGKLNVRNIGKTTT